MRICLMLQVIYGDTDSVMVNFYVSTVEEGMKMGSDAASFVTEKFIKPIKIDFEKVCFSRYVFELL